MQRKILVIAPAAILAVWGMAFAFALEPATYFPVAEGNSWEYKITIPADGDFFYQRYLTYPDGLVWATRGRLPQAKEGVYSLQYVVQERDEAKNAWKIAVKKDDLNLYVDVQKVLWQVWSGKKKMRLEKLLYTREFANWNRSDRWFKEGPESLRQLFFEQPEWVDLEITLEGASLRYFKRSATVSVPAGRFSNCLVLHETVKADEKPNEDFPPSLGWTTSIVYAPNIGLIKQQQKGARDNVLWTMELIRYHVKR